MMLMKAAILHSPNRIDDRDDASFARALSELLLIAND